MQLIPHPFGATVVLAVTVLGGCTSPPEPAKRLTQIVPALQVSFECQDCQVKSTVPSFIQAGYAAAAAKAGISIDEKKHITLTVREYAERSLAMRSVSLVAGPLAFMVKDEIKAVVKIGDREVNIEYFYRIPFSGIESVAERIGELSFERAIN